MRSSATVGPLTLVLALALALVSAAPATAGELAGVDMPDRVSAGDQELVLNGMALRSKFIFKVYVAGLYLPEKTTSADAVLGADQPRHLVMQFVRSVDSGAICDGWYEGLEANTPDAGADLRADFDTLCEYMEDVGSGDSYVFTYLPDSGTTVEVKGQEKGVIAGKAFADALFACWIGPKPGPGEGFKSDLLGG